MQLIPLEDVVAVIQRPRRMDSVLGLECFVVAGSYNPAILASARADKFDYGLLMVPIDPNTRKGMPRFWEPTYH